MLVLWNLVQWWRVGGDGVIVCVWFSSCGWIEHEKRYFRIPSLNPEDVRKFPSQPHTTQPPHPTRNKKHHHPQHANTAPYSTTPTDPTPEPAHTPHADNPYNSHTPHAHAQTPALSENAPSTPNHTPLNDLTHATAIAPEPADTNAVLHAPPATSPQPPHAPTTVLDDPTTYPPPTTPPNPLPRQ
jgi:alpha-ketoglutarate-dependent taurine dioxygenase